MSYLVTRTNAATGRPEYLQPEGYPRAFSRSRSNARRFVTWADADNARCDNEGITQI